MARFTFQSTPVPVRLKDNWLLCGHGPCGTRIARREPYPQGYVALFEDGWTHNAHDDSWSLSRHAVNRQRRAELNGKTADPRDRRPHLPIATTKGPVDRPPSPTSYPAHVRCPHPICGRIGVLDAETLNLVPWHLPAPSPIVSEALASVLQTLVVLPEYVRPPLPPHEDDWWVDKLRSWSEMLQSRVAWEDIEPAVREELRHLDRPITHRTAFALLHLVLLRTYGAATGWSAHEQDVRDRAAAICGGTVPPCLWTHLFKKRYPVPLPTPEEYLLELKREWQRCAAL